MKKIYNKLIRDKIAQVINNRGAKANTKILSNSEYLKELNKKLQEEVNEYFQSGEVEELADIAEVILALAKAKGFNPKEFEKIRLNKVEQRGAFEDKLFLIDIEE